MKKRNCYISAVISLIMCLFSACLLTGCADISKELTSLDIVGGSRDSDGKALAVVGSPHSNEPSFPLNAPSIKDKIYDCCYTYGSVSFITNDANPKVVYQADIPKPEKSGLSENKKNKIAKDFTIQLLKELSCMHAEVSEVDTLKAVSYASKTLSGIKSTDKMIVIMDNGLSTVGYLDFTKGFLYSDTELIVEALEKAEAIPELSDIDILWMYMGQTASPQQELSEVDKHKLEEIWSAILIAGGARNIEFVNDIASDDPNEDLPSVSVVDVQERTIEVETATPIPVRCIIPKPIETIELDSASVSFIGNKAEFVNYEDASDELKKYANLLLEHPDNKVYVIGTTATGSETFCRELSVKRAEKICQVLTSHGVPESQLISLGMGYEDPWHIPDIDDAGRHIEEYACQNRKVLIVDVNSEDATKLSKISSI